jgi:hypothetical protein
MKAKTIVLSLSGVSTATPLVATPVVVASAGSCQAVEPKMDCARHCNCC